MLNSLGGRVRKKRTSLGWSQAHLAQEVGVSVTLVSEIERGKSNPSLAVVVRLAEVLGESLDWLARGSLPAPAGKSFDRVSLDRALDRLTDREFKAILTLLGRD